MIGHDLTVKSLPTGMSILKRHLFRFKRCDVSVATLQRIATLHEQAYQRIATLREQAYQRIATLREQAYQRL